jgi:hypothetical protein
VTNSWFRWRNLPELTNSLTLPSARPNIYEDCGVNTHRGYCGPTGVLASLAVMSQISPDELLSILCKLECELQESATRKDALRLNQILHHDFIEFGRSGNPYTRAEILNELSREVTRSIHAQDFKVHLLATDIALLTYKSAEKCADGSTNRHALRSSLWKLGVSGWQIVFHQGTPTQVFT